MGHACRRRNMAHGLVRRRIYQARRGIALTDPLQEVTKDIFAFVIESVSASIRRAMGVTSNVASEKDQQEQDAHPAGPPQPQARELFAVHQMRTSQASACGLCELRVRESEHDLEARERGNRVRMRIAIDAMGGDYAPDEIVAGAVEAVNQLDKDDELLLLGPQELIQAKLDGLGFKKGPLTVVCLLYTSPSPRDRTRSRMPSSA